MSDNIKIAGLNADNATLLLAAAEELGLEPHVVRTSPHEDAFIVPAEVAEKAGLGDGEKGSSPRKAPAKRTSKRAPAKRTSKKAEAKVEAKSDESKDSGDKATEGGE